MKKATLLVVGFLIAVIICLLFLQVAPKIGLISHAGNSVSNELNILSFLGTITGAIMAASGIIVALVSVYSLSAIEQRTEQKFQDLISKQEKNQEEHTRRIFQAFALQLEAVSTSNLERAEDLMKSALDYYQHLNLARRQMALRLYEATELWFTNTYFKHLSPQSMGNPMSLLSRSPSDETEPDLSFLLFFQFIGTGGVNLMFLRVFRVILPQSRSPYAAFFCLCADFSRRYNVSTLG